MGLGHVTVIDCYFWRPAQLTCSLSATHPHTDVLDAHMQQALASDVLVWRRDRQDVRVTREMCRVDCPALSENSTSTSSLKAL